MVKKRMFLLLVLPFVLLFAIYSAGLADEGEATEEIPEEEKGVYSAAFVSNIIAAFPNLELEPEDIEGLRAKGLGWGEIVIIVSLASASGKDIDEIAALHDEGLGFGEIAKKLDIETRGLGEAVRGALGNAEKKNLDEMAAEELLTLNFDVGGAEMAEFMASGLKKQDLLIAFTAATCVGDSTRLETALSLRQEERSWQEVFETLGIDPPGLRDMKTVMKRAEIRQQIRDAFKEFQEREREKERERARLKEDAGKGNEKDADQKAGDGGNANPPQNERHGKGN